MVEEQTEQGVSLDPKRTCPNCGVPNPMKRVTCMVCHAKLLKKEAKKMTEEAKAKLKEYRKDNPRPRKRRLVKRVRKSNGGMTGMFMVTQQTARGGKAVKVYDVSIGPKRDLSLAEVLKGVEK